MLEEPPMRKKYRRLSGTRSQDWHSTLLNMVFETGYREFIFQTPYMITVNGDFYSHISYFFIRPWWGNADWQCETQCLLRREKWLKWCPCTTQETCGQCMLRPFAAARKHNLECVTNPEYWDATNQNKSIINYEKLCAPKKLI